MPSVAVVHRLGDCLVAARDLVGAVEALTDLIDHVSANHPDVVGIHRELLDMQRPADVPPSVRAAPFPRSTPAARPAVRVACAVALAQATVWV